MQANSEGRLLRGANAIKDYVNDKLAGGTPFSRSAIYRMIESGRLPVTKLGGDRSEIFTTTAKVDQALGLAPHANDVPTTAESAAA